MSKIIHFKADNIKRIKTVDITPKNNTVIIGGKNEQGKTSTLDSIMYALSSARGLPSLPVRRGEDEGVIELEFEGLSVRRVILASGRTELSVRDNSGIPVSSPQRVLDSFLSKLTFDPAAFASFEPKEQIKVLKGLVTGFDFAASERGIKDLEEKRRVIHQRLSDAETRNKDNPYDPSLADLQPIDTAEMLKQFSAIGEAKAAKTALQNEIVRAKGLIRDYENQILEVVSKKTQVEQWLSANEPKLERFVVPSEEAIQAQLESANALNDKLRANESAMKGFLELKDLTREAQNFTKEIEARRAERLAAISEAQLPVSGLSFDEDGVYFGGIPWDQLSGAQRIRVSVGMGIALNPKLKVLLIRDGEKLDEDNLKIIQEMADEYDYQIWIERVGKGEECSIIIEDGMVAEDRTAQGSDSDQNQSVAGA